MIPLFQLQFVEHLISAAHRKLDEGKFNLYTLAAQMNGTKIHQCWSSMACVHELQKQCCSQAIRLIFIRDMLGENGINCKWSEISHPFINVISFTIPKVSLTTRVHPKMWTCYCFAQVLHLQPSEPTCTWRCLFFHVSSLAYIRCY